MDVSGMQKKVRDSLQICSLRIVRNNDILCNTWHLVLFANAPRTKGGWIEVVNSQTLIWTDSCQSAGLIWERQMLLEQISELARSSLTSINNLRFLLQLLYYNTQGQTLSSPLTHGCLAVQSSPSGSLICTLDLHRWSLSCLMIKGVCSPFSDIIKDLLCSL